MPPDIGYDAGPPDAAKWRFVRKRAFSVLQAHGYREIQAAPLDPQGTAQRAASLQAVAVDGHELRRDPQVSIARVFMQHAAADERFARWMTAGNVFDPPAASEQPWRWPAWHAVAGVTFGASDPAAEAELAGLLLTFAADVELTDPEVVLGTVGDAGDVARFLAATMEVRGLACANCRGATNQLRFLSCDDEGCRALAASAPALRSFISIEAQKHHESVLATLEASQMTVRDDPRFGFSVERYNRTVFELRGRLPDGGVLALARGGRRDELSARLSGRKLPAVGLTIGVARVAACVPGDGEAYESSCEIFFAARGAAPRAFALRSASQLRARGFRVDVDLREVGWAEQLQRAELVRARVVVVISDVERRRGEVALRDMSSREVRHIPEDRLLYEVKRLLR